MIKVGISGCDNLRAQELVRVLINHPDVEIKWVSARSCQGSRVDDIVPGLKGESDLMVLPSGSPDDVDLVFMCGSRDEVSSQLLWLADHESLHVIDMSGSFNRNYGGDVPWKYGLGEMQRRLLVHDTRLVTVPGNAAAASLLALLPLARNQMLDSPLTLRVSLGTSAVPVDGKTQDGYTLGEWADDQRQEVEYALKQSQTDFEQPVDLVVKPVDERRTLAVVASLKCGADVKVLRELYEQYYDDHNFVFIVDHPATLADVENTNKCLICLDKDEQSGVLTITAVMDALLKGAAGTAVHAMNLMFGFQERVGLSLKGTGI
jgi:N-acetyl-gamma-glutamyl-phosphate reductase